MNFFDTANPYSVGRSQEILGQCLKDHRDDVIVATNVYTIRVFRVDTSISK
jgi:aryl-alcohol dehydrogenase-like predicted oxidoreductase